MSRSSRGMESPSLQKLEWKYLLHEKITLRISHELKGFCFATVDCVVSSAASILAQQKRESIFYEKYTNIYRYTYIFKIKRIQRVKQQKDFHALQVFLPSYVLAFSFCIF